MPVAKILTPLLLIAEAAPAVIVLISKPLTLQVLPPVQDVITGTAAEYALIILVPLAPPAIATVAAILIPLEVSLAVPLVESEKLKLTRLPVSATLAWLNVAVLISRAFSVVMAPEPTMWSLAVDVGVVVPMPTLPVLMVSDGPVPELVILRTAPEALA